MRSSVIAVTVEVLTKTIGEAAMSLLTDDAHPKLGRKRDLTRDPEILDAALAVLAETGYEGMTIDMVAARAKAGKATVYRRWASKAELVIDAVACMKQGDLAPDQLPDTGTLRGDLVAMIKPHSISDSERKLRVMSGIMSLLTSNPELADTVRESLMEPRARINRMFLHRAIDRGEISPDVDIETIALIGQSMVAYRTIVLREPIRPEFLLSIIDNVVLPAVGLSAPTANLS
jgi:AcrR family transcriptional regulator